jgi:hypothetical protein
MVRIPPYLEHRDNSRMRARSENQLKILLPLSMMIPYMRSMIVSEPVPRENRAARSDQMPIPPAEPKPPNMAVEPASEPEMGGSIISPSGEILPANLLKDIMWMSSTRPYIESDQSGQ